MNQMSCLLQRLVLTQKLVILVSKLAVFNFSCLWSGTITQMAFVEFCVRILPKQSQKSLIFWLPGDLGEQGLIIDYFQYIVDDGNFPQFIDSEMRNMNPLLGKSISRSSRNQMYCGWQGKEKKNKHCRKHELIYNKNTPYSNKNDKY